MLAKNSFIASFVLVFIQEYFLGISDIITLVIWLHKFIRKKNTLFTILVSLIISGTLSTLLLFSISSINRTHGLLILGIILIIVCVLIIPGFSYTKISRVEDNLKK